MTYILSIAGNNGHQGVIAYFQHYFFAGIIYNFDRLINSALSRVTP